MSDYTIDSTYHKLIESIKSHPSLHHQIESKISKIFTKIEIASLSEINKKYCMRFLVVESDISTFFNEYNIFEKDEIKESFLNSWNAPSTAIMLSNTFYHNMLLLYLYGAKNKFENIKKQAFLIILYRIWNGRSIGAFKICDVDTMDYVVSQMLGNKKFVASRYENPKALIQEYFYPTITTKYEPLILSSFHNTKILFTAAYSRIRQIFRFNPYSAEEHSDVAKGETRYKSGLQILYYKAKEEGLKISTSKVVTSGEDAEFSSADYISVNSINEYVDQITNYIIMNSYPHYPPAVIESIKKESISVNNQIIATIMSSLHGIKYTDNISEALTLMFRRISDVSKLNICSDDFFFIIKNKIISSKHNNDIITLKSIIDDILRELFKEKYQNIIYEKFSDQHKIQLRKVVIYFFAYNIQQFICQN